jgi:S-DNA-T family DNA segregation ATPase FtsK/SpoIIIE
MLSEQLADRPRFQRNAAPPDGQPHVVILIDDAEISREEALYVEGGLAGVTMIDLSDLLGPLTARRGMRMVVEEDRIGARGGSGVEWFGKPDTLTEEEATSLSRQLAPYRVAGGPALDTDSGSYEPLTTPLNYIEQLGLAGDVVTFDLNEAWRPRPTDDLYKVAIGPGEQGEIVHLDIKETASGGMGPHGLCIGATGSGKSEFLRTIVLGLMATHSSQMLNFVLVDFKGGATFNGFDTPHVSASISNLEGDGSLIDRMQDALAGEMNRRQEVLNKAGAKNVWDYRKMAEAGDEHAQEPLPALFVVIDEFSELLSQQPEFAELFVMIGRLGRSLQVHLLLASQRLEEGKLRGLDSHLSYRIGLKTFNAAESRAAIGVPDAADLPATGGHGYLKHPNGMDASARPTSPATCTRPAVVVRRCWAGPRRSPARRCRATSSRTSSRSPRNRRRRTSRRSRKRPSRSTPTSRSSSTSSRSWPRHRRTRSGCRRWTLRPLWTPCCRRCSPPTTAATPPPGTRAAPGCRSRSASSTFRTTSARTP